MKTYDTKKDKSYDLFEHRKINLALHALTSSFSVSSSFQITKHSTKLAPSGFLFAHHLKKKKKRYGLCSQVQSSMRETDMN